MLNMLIRKYKFVAMLIFFHNATATEFSIQNFSADIINSGVIYSQPFTGGTNYARVSWIDWDQDNDVDLFLLDEDFHFRYFENIGNSLQSNFIIANHPIQSLSGMSWFYLGDFDSDGQVELACQSSLDPDQVMYYVYNGSEFILVSTILQSNGIPVYSASAMKPAFCDIDNDGDLDFFTGDVSGTISYYSNIGFSNNAPVYELISTYWEEIFIVGPSARHGASAITFIDIDTDGDYDLAWGDYFQRSLYVIWNIGTADSPIMDSENFAYQYPENDPIYTSGQNMPSFADIDGDNDMDLFITVLGGDGPVQLSNNFLMYENTGSPAAPDFNLLTENFLGSLDLLSDVIPEFIDIDADGDLDMFVGQDYTTETNPTMGRIYFFLNEGLEHPTWTLQDSSFLGEEIGLSLSPEFVDIDADNDYDLFVGDYNGKIKFFKNEGTPTDYQFVDNGYLENIDLGFFSIPRFYDIDSDGDFDMIVGNYAGGLYLYLNNGNANNYDFIETEFQVEGISELARTSPEFYDFDKDGDYDLFVGTEKSGLKIFWNQTSTSNLDMYFVEDECIEVPYMGMHLKPAITNISGESIVDFYTGLSTGGILHYRVSPFGDINQDLNTDIMDIIETVNYILFGTVPEKLCLSDFNHDQLVSVEDVVIMVSSILN